MRRSSAGFRRCDMPGRFAASRPRSRSPAKMPNGSCSARSILGRDTGWSCVGPANDRRTSKPSCGNCGDAIRDRPIWLLLDKASFHQAIQSQQLAAHLDVTLLWLPKQCPELNCRGPSLERVEASDCRQSPIPDDRRRGGLRGTVALGPDCDRSPPQSRCPVGRLLAQGFCVKTFGYLLRRWRPTADSCRADR